MYPEFADNFWNNLEITFNLRDVSCVDVNRDSRLVQRFSPYRLQIDRLSAFRKRRFVGVTKVKCLKVPFIGIVR